MIKRSVRALVLLNVVLIGALLLVTLTAPTAVAQLRGSGGTYTMIAGKIVRAGDQEAVFIIDKATKRMVAVTFDPNTGRLQVLGSRAIGNDTESRPTRRSR